MAKSDDSLILVGVLGIAWLLYSRTSALGTAPGIPAAVLGGTGGLNLPAQKDASPMLAGGSAPALEQDNAAPSIFVLEQNAFIAKQQAAMPVAERATNFADLIAAGFTPLPSPSAPAGATSYATHPPVGKGPGY